MTYRNRKLRESARGQDCQLRIPGICNGNPETTVWAHLNGHKYGKGMGHKSHDLFGLYACSACHTYYDSRSYLDPGIEQQVQAACLRSLKIACDEGVL